MFKCYTVNVKNDLDEKFIEFLDSDEFKAGLKLVSSLQPAISPLSKMAYNLTRNIANRNKNIPVQEFCMGLVFSNIPCRTRLREGI